MFIEVVLKDCGLSWKEIGLVTFVLSVLLLDVVEVGFWVVCDKLAGEEDEVKNRQLVVFVACWKQNLLGGESVFKF